MWAVLRLPFCLCGRGPETRSSSTKRDLDGHTFQAAMATPRAYRSSPFRAGNLNALLPRSPPPTFTREIRDRQRRKSYHSQPQTLEHSKRRPIFLLLSSEATDADWAGCRKRRPMVSADEKSCEATVRLHGKSTLLRGPHERGTQILLGAGQLLLDCSLVQVELLGDLRMAPVVTPSGEEDCAALRRQCMQRR